MNLAGVSFFISPPNYQYSFGSFHTGVSQRFFDMFGAVEKEKPWGSQSCLLFCLFINCICGRISTNFHCMLRTRLAFTIFISDLQFSEQNGEYNF